MMRLSDAHLHLTDYQEPMEVIWSSRSRGMTLLSCTVSSAQAEMNLRLAEQNPETVKCFLGVHPSEVRDGIDTGSDDSWGALLQRCDGIGEIGLDPKYSPTCRGSAQMRCFVAQLESAERMGMPVQVHSRDSEVECLDVLGSFSLHSVMMHWFEGQTAEAVQGVVSRGYYVSFGPALLYSKRLRKLAEQIPKERVLTESDGPVSFGAIGGAGGPDTIPSVLFRLAEVLGCDFLEMGVKVEENLGRYLAAGEEH